MARIETLMDSPIPRMIYDAVKAHSSDWRRPHLGASMIGKDCKRELWYSFRWAKAPDFDGRLLRLFETGNRFEDRIVEELQLIGIVVSDRQKYIDTGVNHFSGSIDGIAEGFPESNGLHLVEFKTHATKSWTALPAQGVKLAKPQHWLQMHVYMGALELKRAYYIAVNKDTDQLYAERVKYDEAVYAEARAKAAEVITAATPPARIEDNPARFACRFCNYRTMCHGQDVPEVNCRTCCHSDPSTTGSSWICNRHGPIDTDLQKAGCPDHLFIPQILSLDPVDAGEDWIKYGTGWTNRNNSKEYKLEGDA